jgi:hypothetical protein
VWKILEVTRGCAGENPCIRCARAVHLTTRVTRVAHPSARVRSLCIGAWGYWRREVQLTSATARRGGGAGSLHWAHRSNRWFASVADLSSATTGAVIRCARDCEVVIGECVLRPRLSLAARNPQCGTPRRASEPDRAVRARIRRSRSAPRARCSGYLAACRRPDLRVRQESLFMARSR